MRLIPRVLLGDKARGHWWGEENGVVWFSCPSCGSVTEIGDDIVSQDGVVANFICTTDECSFYDHVKLDGYGEEILR